MSYSLVSDLGDVDKSVNAVNDLSECAECCKAYDLNACNVTLVILSGKDSPRIANSAAIPLPVAVGS